MKITKFDCNQDLYPKLSKEHEKNLNLINQKQYLLWQKLDDFLKDFPIKNCYQHPYEPNTYYVLAQDNRRFIVKFFFSFENAKSVKSNFSIKELI